MSGLIQIANLLDGQRRLSKVGLCSVMLLAGACAAPAPQPAGNPQGGMDAESGSPCTEPGKSEIAKSAGASAIERLCSYQRSLIDDSKYFYNGPGGTKTAPLFPSSPAEEVGKLTEGAQNVARLVFYTGLKVASKDPQAVADVLRLQTHFPSEYKSNGFTAEADVTFTPSSPDLVKFSGTSYSYLKPAQGTDKRIEYQGRVEIFSFGGGGVAVVDKLVQNVNNSMLIQHNGLLLIIPDKDYVAVIGRTEQVLGAERQSLQQVQDKLALRVTAAVERDFLNYKRAADAKKVMDDKRSKSSGK
ncbi:MAG: hypothetical protein RIQ81_2527 [Pseudomonadota bacterium]|jgi:hypothetical protein